LEAEIKVKRIGAIEVVIICILMLLVWESRVESVKGYNTAAFAEFILDARVGWEYGKRLTYRIHWSCHQQCRRWLQWKMVLFWCQNAKQTLL